MMQVNYELISDKLFLNYLDFLVGKIFKMLPMKEYHDSNLQKYAESLKRELLGNQDLIVALKYDGNFQTILNKIQYLISNDIDLKIYRKEIFDCISLIKKLKMNYVKEVN